MRGGGGDDFFICFRSIFNFDFFNYCFREVNAEIIKMVVLFCLSRSKTTTRDIIMNYSNPASKD